MANANCTVLDMREKQKQGGRVHIGIRATAEDQKIFAALMKRLGVDPSQIIRLGIRALCQKEGVEIA